MLCWASARETTPRGRPHGRPRAIEDEVWFGVDTVAAGDSLSKIAKQFYGNANEYMKIFEANKDRLTDPNVIKVGQQLVIPS